MSIGLVCWLSYLIWILLTVAIFIRGNLRYWWIDMFVAILFFLIGWYAFGFVIR